MKPTLVVLAAGMGSRYGGVKQIDAVGKNGECLLDFSAYDARKAGFGKVVFIIRPDIEKDFRERLFDRVAANMDAEYVFQTKESLLTQEEIARAGERTKPWGTLHAVLCAEKAIKTPFAVINSDDYYGAEAFETLGKHLASIPADSPEHSADRSCRIFNKLNHTRQPLVMIKPDKHVVLFLFRLGDNLAFFLWLFFFLFLFLRLFIFLWRKNAEFQEEPADRKRYIVLIMNGYNEFY